MLIGVFLISDESSRHPLYSSTSVRPDMTSNMRGPVTVVIGVQNVFTSNFPEGDSRLTDSDFRLLSVVGGFYNGERFKIGKSW